MAEPAPPSTTVQRPVALVTGAARRLGREIALELARGGHDIALHYRSSRREAKETRAALQDLGARCEIFDAELSDEAQCQALVPRVVAVMQRLDAVVNNASAFVYDDVQTFSHASLDRHLKANTAPAILLARALDKYLADERDTAARGCVVNLSDQKLWNPNPDYFAYTLSKAALESATQMLAMALAPRVRVCGVAPGVTLVSGTMSDEEFKTSHAQTPLQRSSTPTDIARTVRFLVESPAITGTTLMVDGGQHLARQPRDVMFIARQSPLKE